MYNTDFIDTLVGRIVYWLVAFACVVGLIYALTGCLDPKESNTASVELVLESITGGDMCPGEVGSTAWLTVDTEADSIVELATLGWDCAWVSPGVECTTLQVTPTSTLQMRVWVDIGHKRAAVTYGSVCVHHYRVESVTWLP